MMARFAAAGDEDAQANLLATFASPRSWPAARARRWISCGPGTELLPEPDGFRSRASVAVPARHVRAGPPPGRPPRGPPWTGRGG